MRRALVCAPYWPEFDRESGSKRVWDHIQILLAAGWSVTFIALTGKRRNRYAALLRQQGVATFVGMNRQTEAVIAAAAFDVALLAFWQVAEVVAPIIRSRSPQTSVIVDSIDLHFLREARQRLQPDPQSGKIRRLKKQHGRSFVGELNTYATADAVLTVSEREARLINDLVNRPGLAVHVPDMESLAKSPVPFAARRGILFVGNFRHPPNIEALDMLSQHILPLLAPELLRAHPVSIVGTGLELHRRAVRQLPPGARPVGWVPSIIPYLEQAVISIVPLRHGAGTKRKVIQSLMIGTPVVTTTIGAEGLNIVDECHALVADHAAAFATAIARVIRDESLWTRLATEGRAHALAHHGEHVAQTTFLAVLDRMLGVPHAHRRVSG